MSSFLTRFGDSRPFQLSIYTVFDKESDVQVKHKQILEPEGKIARFGDSRPFQLSTYTVFHEESDVQVKNKQIFEPEGKN